MKKFCVFVSGGGTNLQALIDAVEDGRIEAEICGVIASKEHIGAIERAEKHGIPSCVVRRKDYEDEPAYTGAMLKALDGFAPDFIVLAGFLSILSRDVIQRYPNRIMNVHPSLIPSFCGKGYYGLKVHQAALDYGVKVTGATVHFVDDGTDTGPVIYQKSVEILPEDTAETLQRRGMEQAEHILLPLAVQKMAQGKIHVEGRHVGIEGGND